MLFLYSQTSSLSVSIAVSTNEHAIDDSGLLTNSVLHAQPDTKSAARVLISVSENSSFVVHNRASSTGTDLLLQAISLLGDSTRAPNGP